MLPVLVAQAEELGKAPYLSGLEILQPLHHLKAIMGGFHTAAQITEKVVAVVVHLQWV
jgi:hypothetical protein